VEALERNRAERARLVDALQRLAKGGGGGYSEAVGASPRLVPAPAPDACLAACWAALGQHLAALEQHRTASINASDHRAGSPLPAPRAAARAVSTLCCNTGWRVRLTVPPPQHLCLGWQVSASAALKANAEARAVIANGLQMWFTCELLSLEQQVQASD
jgi:hypothetical protein